MDFQVIDSSGTDDDLLPSQYNQVTAGGLVAGNGRSFLSSASYQRTQSDMEFQIHILEQEAYGAILRAFKAQSDALTWEKEGLITELRKELRVSDDEHRELLTKVNADALIRRIREWRKAGGSLSTTPNLPPPVHDQLHSPTVSQPPKKQKTTHSVPFGVQSQTLHPQSIPTTTQASLPTKWPPASGNGGRRPQPVGQRGYHHPSQAPGAPPFSNELAQRTCDPLIGRKVMTRWPEDNNFYEAIITEYKPREGWHALVYDINTPNETLEWVDLKEISREDIRWIGDDPGISLRTGNSEQELGGNVFTAGRGRGSLRDQPVNDVRPSENGIVRKDWDEIEILHTDTLIQKVEKVVAASHPDLVEIDKAKKMLKDHEQTLINVIEKLAEACDGGSDAEQQSMHREHDLGNVYSRNLCGLGRVGGYNIGGGQIALDSQQDDDVVII